MCAYFLLGELILYRYMRKKYLLADKQFWLEIISLADLCKSPIHAKAISASDLKRRIVNTESIEVFITSTTPTVYCQIENHLFCVQCRPFLSLLTNLYEIEENIELDWRIDGF